ncbi:PKD domain-containing protein [Stigmatella sp. ncwal1]|uniref:PKD domain-containing protein n=1 Tax=Stigmatella ashevillensis TaxID=2995309 RepID=A0ABT5DEH0_9BACT|nr:PKD domain-containing protein [Stigmatella ashevillena]MDC0710716.1 PKD domain-containing protein [Stigmatella ashevillena]
MNRWVWVFVSLVGVVSAAEVGENAPAPENIRLHTLDGITKKAVNQPPVAHAGEDASVFELSSLELDGTLSSDPDGDALTYLWTQIDHSSFDLIGATTAKPVLHAPSASYDQHIVYTLTVSDGEFTASDQVTVVVRNHPGSPIAIIAAPEQGEVSTGQLVTLDGSPSTDPDGDPLTFSWVQVEGPEVELTGANTAQITFTAPMTGTPFTLLRFKLTVSDGTTLSAGALTSITVRLNRPPIISAGNDLFVEEGSTVLVYGSGYDPEGTRLTYQWTQTAGPPAQINPTGHPQPYIFLPEVTETTVFTFMLTASDGVHTVSDSMNITVRNRAF